MKLLKTLRDHLSDWLLQVGLLAMGSIVYRLRFHIVQILNKEQLLYIALGFGLTTIGLSIQTFKMHNKKSKALLAKKFGVPLCACDTPPQPMRYVHEQDIFVCDIGICCPVFSVYIE